MAFAAFEYWASSGFGPARAADRTNAMGQVSFDLGDDWSLRLLATFHAGRFDSPGVVLQSDLDRPSFDRFSSYDPDQGGASSRAHVLAELAYAGPAWEAKLSPFVARRTLELQFNFTGGLGDEASDNAVQQNDFTTVGLRASLARDLPLFADSDRVELGVFARHDDIDQLHRSTDGAVTFADADVTATNAAAYLDIALHPLPRTVVRGGIRVDGLFFATEDALDASPEARKASGVHVGPKATVDVAIRHDLHALASYGKGFRSPQARSLVDGESTPFTDVHAFEGGLRYNGGPALSVTAAGFASLLSDDLVFNESTSRNEAVPATLRAGGTVDMQNRVGELVHAFSVTYTRASFRGSDSRFDEGDLVPFVPQVLLRSDVAYTPVLATLLDRELRGHFGVGVDGLARRPLPFGEIGSDILLFDASMGLRLREVELRVDAQNLLDTRYNDAEFVYASNWGADPSPLPRRHASVGSPLTVLGTLALHL
ncbi:MAG: TonB-dependent receptor [Myxococcota bacterium]